MMRIVAVIPARMGSSRFPGKPLATLLGRPMIEHVYRSTAACRALDDVLVATCDAEIARVVEAFGGRVVMTSPAHERASDRVAEAVQHDNAGIVVMVQGDEPMIVPGMIEEAISPLLDEPELGCVNLVAPISTIEELRDPNTIKVVMGIDGNALYFSREPIPALRDRRFLLGRWHKQVCVIPFRREALTRFAELPPTPLEQAESIDMLRFIEHGIPVRLVPTDIVTHAVDTSEDLRLVEALLSTESDVGAVN